MTTLTVIGPDGTQQESVTTPDGMLDAPVNVPLIHQVVVAQLAAARQGTHAAKSRGQVRGGGRKPYKQKGTGRARQGSIRAPQFAGGGVVHPPVPRDYSQRTPKKMIAAATRGALSDRAAADRIRVVDSFLAQDAAPSTRAAQGVLDAVSSSRRPLVVLSRSEQVAARSLRNIARVHLLTSDQLNAYDVLCSDDVIFTRTALDEVIARHGRRAGASQENTTEVSA